MNKIVKCHNSTRGSNYLKIYFIKTSTNTRSLPICFKNVDDTLQFWKAGKENHIDPMWV